MQNFLRQFLFCFTIIFVVPFAQAASLPMSLFRDGNVRFYLSHTDEYLELHYADTGGHWISGVENKIRKLFRSREDDKEFSLDPRLIELADHLQDYFGADTVEVISGYRSPEFNRHLKETGHNVANESFHTKGLAMDIHLDEIDETKIRDYLLSLKLGGVGYYGNKLMVHMDLGPVRVWTDGGFVENTEVGIFNTDSHVKLRTDRLRYGMDNELKLTLTEIGADKVLLQKYFRGSWVTAKTVVLVQKPFVDFKLSGEFFQAVRNVAGVYGKYRFRVEHGNEWQNSNEFYVKKQWN